MRLLRSDIAVMGSDLYEIKTSPYGKLETKSYFIPREMGRYCFTVESHYRGWIHYLDSQEQSAHMRVADKQEIDLNVTIKSLSQSWFDEHNIEMLLRKWPISAWIISYFYSFGYPGAKASWRHNPRIIYLSFAYK
jgi:hypothetical protein